MRTDIMGKRLYIGEIRDVIASRLVRRGKPNLVSCRRGDGMILVLSGGCDYTFDDGTRFTVRAGDLLYLADRAAYRMDIHEGVYAVLYCNFLFSDPALRQSAAWTLKNAAEAEALFRALQRAHASPEPSSFFESLSLLYKIYGIAFAAAHPSYVSSAVRNRIVKARERIDREYGDSLLTVAVLAAEAQISEVYFRKLFRAVCGVSPIRYITVARLEAARRRLMTEETATERIALSVGFSTLSYFCRVFKAEYGVSPSVYRREVQ